MSLGAIWFTLAGLLAVGEILTGTFFLLLAACGALAAAGISYLGYNLITQIFVGAIITLLGWFFLYRFRPRKDAQSNPDMNMDIGAHVKITQVNSDGSVDVSYRGSNWQAVIEDKSPPDLNTTYKIKRIEGAKLILEKE